MPASHALHTETATRGPRRFVSVGLVAALHVVVIYGLLIGIHVVPSPVPLPPNIIVDVFNKPPPISRPVPPSGGPTFAHPRDYTPPVLPDFKIDDSSRPANPPITSPRLGGGGNVAPGPTLGPIAIAETHTIPPYPMIGIRLGHEGTVRLAISLDEDGNVVAAQVERSSGYQELDAAAVVWVRSHWRYRPAMRDGQPIRATVPAMVTFRLDQIRG
jgi:protein TonB